MRDLRNWAWLAAEGIVIGVLASYLSRMTEWTDLLLDSIAGVSGSLLVAWFISPLNRSAAVVDLSSFLLAALGAASVVCLEKMISSGRGR